jgi:cell division protease FtsH
VEDRELLPLLREKKVEIVAQPPADNTFMLLVIYLFVPLLLFAGLWVMLRRTRDQFLGGGILSGFSKSPAKRYEETGKKPITFNDVAGLENVKNDLQEIVEFLKNPEKFARLGGRVPKGVLLMGPPGTGKTLLARAVAGEAGVPFFSISGSEFIQMFVGVGASRVRDMFKTAKEASPCILFIDEIDAVGRHRGAGLGGGHDEREQTLNQILSEMDGFSQTEAVIVLAATNRPDVLDPALLRPGRFDRHVTVDRPNQRARLAIFKVHTRDVPLAADVNMERLAAGTVGLTGADIRNLVNEAALWATRNGKDKVDMDDFEFARDKVLMGPKREELLTGKEKKMTAYHEAGHALLAWILPGVDRLHKVTIIPRGRALGVTQLVPDEDRFNIGQSELNSQLVLGLGGRAAEKMVFNEYSAGAENDLMRVTKLARRMVAHWGMSDVIGPVAYRTGEEHPFLGREIYEQREFSENSARVIDEEVSRILHEADLRAMELLSQHRENLDALAAALEQREVLDESEVEEILGPSLHPRNPADDSANGSPTAGKEENGKPGDGKLPAEKSGRSGSAENS